MFTVCVHVYHYMSLPCIIYLVSIPIHVTALYQRSCHFSATLVSLLTVLASEQVTLCKINLIEINRKYRYKWALWPALVQHRMHHLLIHWQVWHEMRTKIVMFPMEPRLLQMLIVGDEEVGELLGV